MDDIHCKIMGVVPSKSNCYRIITINGHGSLAKTTAMKKYEESFFWQVGSARDKMIDVPFEFHIDVFYPSKRSDLDNSFKVILDCLQKAKVIKNDNNCSLIYARKFIDKENPRVEFTIKKA
jgi:Holliday junction resolvase RusA-like endonuclease